MFMKFTICVLLLIKLESVAAGTNSEQSSANVELLPLCYRAPIDEIKLKITLNGERFFHLCYHFITKWFEWKMGLL